MSTQSDIKAGCDLTQDLEYLLKDLILDKNTENVDEVTKICLTTIGQIYVNYNEDEIRKMIVNILNVNKPPSQQKLKLKLTKNQEVPSLKQDFNKQSLVIKKIEIIETSEKIEREIQKAESPAIEIQKIELQTMETRKIELQTIETQKIESPQKMETNEEKIHRFMKMPHYKQKSKQWLDQRNSYLTASTIAAALGLMGPVARRNLLLSKVSNGKINGFSGNPATHWGNKYEPVANGIYAYRNGAQIHEFGMITNEKYPILGVSPDGITGGKMLEIKCPFSRIIDGKIKTEYQHQMQEQMAVCEYDECDFLECRFEEVSFDRFWDDFDYYDENENINREKGIVITYVNIDDCENDDFSIEYLYSPIEYHTDIGKMKEWEEKTISDLRRDGHKLYLQQTYWHLITYSCQLVQRDPSWIINSYPVLEEFWKEVEFYRKEGIEKLLEKIEKEKVDIEKAIDDQLSQENDSDEELQKINEFFKNNDKKKSAPTTLKLSPTNNKAKQKSSTTKAKPKTKTKTKVTEPKGQCLL